jgi:peroxiredoxin
MTPSLNETKFLKAKVLDENGQAVSIDHFWKDQTAVFVFLRHFGCIACRGEASQVWARHAEVENAGAKLIFVGNGPAWAINGFKEDLKIPASVYTDPTLEIFKAAAFKRGKWTTLGPRSIVNGIKLMLRGHRQKKLTGDPWQQGGVVVVNKSGHVVYTHADQSTGNSAPWPNVLASLKK